MLGRPRTRSPRLRALGLGALAIVTAGVLAGCSDDFDKAQAEVDVEETYDLFTAAVFTGDGPVACALLTENLVEDLFTIGPTGVTPEGGTCEGRMGQQGLAIEEEYGGEPTATIEDIEVSLVADDGSQPFAPGGLVAWADAQSVVDGEASPIRLFLIQDDWLIGSLPEPFVPSQVLGGEVIEEPEPAEPQ